MILRILLHIPLMRWFFRRAFAPRGIYEYTIARTKCIDKVFVEALAEGFDQAVILGAGFDTRALRFQREAVDVTIFELDVPITQEAKLDRYKEQGLAIPGNVKFIPIDFDRESLSDKLLHAGFDKGGRSLFVLEGVLMYLQPASVDTTFKVMERLTGEGSEVVFDYVRASVFREPGSIYGGREIFRSVAKAGERWHFGIEEAQLYAFLESYGLRAREHENARELEQRYFVDASGEVVGRINGAHCLVRAVRTPVSQKHGAQRAPRGRSAIYGRAN
jgi:methyltransferase (TIGR00027 family)